MDRRYLAIFDLDGTLFDTGDVNYYAYRDALQPYGITLDKKYFVTKCNGRHYREFLPEIMGTTEYLESVHTAKKNAYASHLGKARENKQLFQIISGLRQHYYIALVTTASRKNAMDILSCFGHKDDFDLMITQEDITKMKPDPQGFLLAMTHYGVDAEHTLIFEDSEVGVQAARATGASVFVVDCF